VEPERFHESDRTENEIVKGGEIANSRGNFEQFQQILGIRFRLGAKNWHRL